MDNNYYANGSNDYTPMESTHSNSGTVMILGILSLFVLPIVLAPITLVLYNKNKLSYSPEDMGGAKVGFICACIALGIWASTILISLLAIVAYFSFVALVISR